jgi:putative autotransporter adhesin-like protein
MITAQDTRSPRVWRDAARSGQGEDNLLPLVTTQVKNGRLVIGASRGFKTTLPMRVDVTVPTLKAITLAGSGIVSASAIVTRKRDKSPRLEDACGR